MDKSAINTVNKQCRTCLTESNNIRLLQDDIILLDSNMKISQLIMECASVQITTEDVLPNIICNICVDYASSSFIFRRKCEESERKLKSELIKTEDSVEFIAFTKINDISNEDIQASNIDKNLSEVLQTQNEIDRSGDYATDNLTPDINYTSSSDSENDDDNVPLINIKKELETNYTCADCPASFTTIPTIRLHEQQHLFDKIYTENFNECIECDQPFDDRQDLFQHFLTHSSYKCRTCKKRVKSIHELADHNCEMELVKKTCEICGKVSGSVAHNKRHLLSHNSSVSACKYCDFKSGGLKRAMDLSLHMKTSHDELRKVKCPECPKRYFTNVAMHQHHQAVHTGQKKHICDYCGKMFAQAFYLKQHIPIHTGERAFSCTVCEKQFIQYASLTSHMNMHLPRQQHVCPICGKTSPSKGGLRMHMNRHRDDRPFHCSVCNKAFKSKPELEKHEKIHTGEKPHECEVCGKGFIQAQSLKAHMRTHNRRTLHSGE